MNRLSPQIRQAAVTLTELLVVLVIISTLSTIALPVYVNQAEKARIAAAQQEVAELAKAEETCGIVHGLYLPLYLLNNIPGDGSGGDPDDDTIGEINDANAFDFMVPPTQLEVAQINFGAANTNPRLRNLIEDWEGPFINFQREYDDTPEDPTDENEEDFPLDPWGNPYRLYSPVGVVGTDDVRIDYNVSDFNQISQQDDRFDRWAVVSYGPDGENDETGSAATQVRDDIFFVFGSAQAETDFQITNPNPTPVP